MKLGRRRSFSFLRAFFASCVLGCAASLSAASGGFSTTLSSTDAAAAGLTRLSAAERDFLDQLVANDLAQIRVSDAIEPTETFFGRRTDKELAEAGLARLSPTEIVRLNQLVTGVLAARPKPRERPRLRDNEIFEPATKPEVHGSISFTYGRGSGGQSFHGSSFWVDVTYPDSGLYLGIGVSSFSGKGLRGYYPGYNRFGYDYGSPFFFNGPFGDDFAYGQEDYLAFSPGLDFGDGRRGRH